MKNIPQEEHPSTHQEQFHQSYYQPLFLHPHHSASTITCRKYDKRLENAYQMPVRLKSNDLLSLELDPTYRKA